MSRIWTEFRLAIGALIEENTLVSRHRFILAVLAGGTREKRLQNDFSHGATLRQPLGYFKLTLCR